MKDALRRRNENETISGSLLAEDTTQQHNDRTEKVFRGFIVLTESFTQQKKNANRVPCWIEVCDEKKSLSRAHKAVFQFHISQAERMSDR